MLNRAYEAAKKALKSSSPCDNHMKKIYDAIPEDELHAEIAHLLTPPGLKAELKVVYQTVDALHSCCPDYPGDWYFTGDYPTPGGFRMVNRALVQYMENNHERAY